MVIERTLFGCEICGTQYTTIQKARSCEDQDRIEPPALILSHLYRVDVHHKKSQDQRLYALFMDHVEEEPATYPGHFPEYHSLLLNLTSSFKKQDLSYSLTQHQLFYDPGQLSPVSLEEYLSLKPIFLENTDLHTEEYMHYTERISFRNKKKHNRHPIIHTPLESLHTDLRVLVNHEKYESAAKLRDIIKELENDVLHTIAWSTQQRRTINF